MLGVECGHVVLYDVTSAEEAVPVRDTLDGDLAFWQPEVALVMSLHGGALRVAPKTQQEARDAPGFVIGGMGYTSERWDMVVVPKRLKSPQITS